MRKFTILMVDDNRDLLRFLERLMEESGWTLLTAETGSAARKLVEEHKPDAALIDYMLPDANGVELGVEFLKTVPTMFVITMTGTLLPPEEEALVEAHNFRHLQKPFLASDVISAIKSGLQNRPGGEAEETVVRSRALRVFVSYSHRDEIWQKRLDAHLSMLKHMGIIHSWHDRKLIAGDDFERTIDKYLDSSDLVLLLISPDFLGSDYCYRKEMGTALARHNEGRAQVIPVIVRPVDWEKAPFAHLQAVPKNGRPITLWANRDEALMDAAKSIRRAAEDLSASLNRR